jgi:hypothetical protein
MDTTTANRASARAVNHAQAYTDESLREIRQHLARVDYHAQRVELHEARMRLIIHCSVLTIGIALAIVWVACPPLLLPVVGGGPAIMIELIDKWTKGEA